MAILDDLVWYTDPTAPDEPGIRHSFVACLASAINYLTGNVDPVWLMGTSGFAFRMFVNETMCPSAMSVFDWTDVLPAAVENAGFECTYLSRLWHEGDKEEERREEAALSIAAALEQGRPSIVWDVRDSEWGLIVGHESGVFHALSNTGASVRMPVDRLGRNGIDVLSVAIPGARNERSPQEGIDNSLRVAVNHARRREWTDRPEYQNGLDGFELWATIHDRAALLAGAGKATAVSEDIVSFGRYYAEHHYSARRYAHDYLSGVARDIPELKRAAEAYGRVTQLLREVWGRAGTMTAVDDSTALRTVASTIRDAASAEEEAIGAIESYLG